jgi:hypothetical protein
MLQTINKFYRRPGFDFHHVRPNLLGQKLANQRGLSLKKNKLTASFLSQMLQPTKDRKWKK